MSHPKLQLDLDLILPDATGLEDTCIYRLMNDLSARHGVTKVHVAKDRGDALAKLCIHYDPDVLSLVRVQEIVHLAGAQLTERYGHVVWQVDGLRHERRARTIEERLASTQGVIEAVAVSAGLLRIEFDRTAISEADLSVLLRSLGVTRQEAAQPGGGAASQSHFQTAPSSDAELRSAPATEHAEHPSRGQDHDHDHDHGSTTFGQNSELYFALICGALVGLGYFCSRIGSAPGWLTITCYVAAYLFGGFYSVREALDSLRNRRFEIDTLMIVAAIGAGALGEWAEGALLLFLFSLGHSLEHYAMARARRAVEALAKLAPSTAEVRRDGGIREIPVAELIVGDIVIARPNVRIPADGFVLSGTSSVNQAPVTGESTPADKQPVDDRQRAASKPDAIDAERRVYAGTINGSGALEIQVTRLASDTALARVVRMVSEAETQKSPTQRFTDRLERIFVPAILGFVVLLLFAGLVVDEPFSASFYRAMAVLVAASPCALAIATPSAVLSGVARAARSGILVKGGGPLEDLGTLNSIAFDKTGTLTEGRPRVTDVVPTLGATEANLLAVAIAIEKLSDHPLAAAVVRDGEARLANTVSVPVAQDVRSITGRGVSSQIDGDPVLVGKPVLFTEVGGTPIPGALQAEIEKLQQQGRTVIVVRRGDRYLGVLGLMDTPREPAKQVVARLRELGITRMVMLSGDARSVVEAVAHDVGIEEAWGDLMPEDKVEAIKKLRQQQNVAMIGDGVNDAPAMAHATVGVAMGAAGSAVALETADVALMADDLRALPLAVGLSRRTSAIIRQNLWLSLGMVAVLIPAAMFGLKMGVAVIFHEGSTLLVVVNALRLLAYREES